MDTAFILSVVASCVSLSTLVIGVINHKRIRSQCCDKKVEVSLDIENTTPPISTDSKSKSKEVVQVPDVGRGY
jgi:hypothetical protein